MVPTACRDTQPLQQTVFKYLSDELTAEEAVRRSPSMAASTPINPYVWIEVRAGVHYHVTVAIDSNSSDHAFRKHCQPSFCLNPANFNQKYSLA